MSELDESLLELAQAYGIATEYWDWQGHHVSVAAETVIAVLAGLEVDASTTERAWEALAAHHREPWTRMLPRCVATREGHPYVITVHVTDGDPVDIWVELESGAGRGMRQLENWTPAREIDGRWVGEASFEIPGDLPLGYHTVRARSGGQEAAMPLIITPAWLGIPERVGERRAWGLATQLYSVRSHDSWGVGDLSDLTDLAVWSGGTHGADYILINPLHAAEPVPPMEPSPYLPSTRRFFNPLYIRPERIPEGGRAGREPTRRRRRPARRSGHPGVVGDRRPQRGLDRQAGGAADHLPRAPVRGTPARLQGVPPARRRGAGAVRPVGGAERAARAALPGLAGRAAAPRLRPGRRVHRPARGRHRLRLLAAVGAGRAAGGHPDGERASRYGAGHHARSGGRRAPVRGRCLGPEGHLRPGHLGGGAPGPVQPERAELEPATVATGPARRPGVRALPGDGAHHPAARRRHPGRSRDRAVPTVVDPRGCGSDEGHLRPQRPRGDGRHPGAGGAPGRRGGGRRGPGHGRAVGPGLPPRAGDPRHLDPVVRVRLPRRRVAAGSASCGGSTAWPR